MQNNYFILILTIYTKYFMIVDLCGPNKGDPDYFYLPFSTDNTYLFNITVRCTVLDLILDW